MTFYAELAKKAVEKYLKKGQVLEPPQDLPPKMLKEKAGVFVTIEKQGRLKGCVGTCLPTKENIAEEIIDNAIASAAQDYRFSPVQKEELPYLTYTVSILSAPEKVEDQSVLNPKKYGIIIKTESFPIKSALLLPDLRGIETIEQQLNACRKKAGAKLEEKINIYKFTVEKHQ